MNHKNFDWGYFLKHIAIIAVPVALQNLLTTTGSMVDTIMIGSQGELSVAAVGICSQISSLFFSCYFGFAGGSLLFFSQYWGARDHDGITRSYGMTLLFMMTVGVLFACLAIFAPEFVMGVYTDKPEIQKIGISYLRIVGFAYPLQVIAMAASALLRSIEQVKIPLYGGAAGAAVGTVMAGIVNVLILVICILYKRIPYVLEFSRHFRWSKVYVKQYLEKCFPIICNEVFIGVGNMLINIVLGRQSEQAIAAVAVFRTLEGLIIAFFSGFSNAASVLVGKEVGAGNHEAAYQRGKRLVYLCSGIIAVACLTLLLIHNPLLHTLGLSGESYRIGTGMLIIYSMAAIIRMGNWTQNDTYRSAGDAAFGSILEITFMYLMVLPFVYLSNFYFHAPFLLVFAFCYIDEPIRYTLMQHHLYSGKWIRPVSGPGLATIDAFRQKHGIKIKQKSAASVK